VTKRFQENARRAAVLALMLFLGATGCKDAVLVDLCCLPVLAGQVASMTERGLPRELFARG
jgi:hypothetical protein